MAELVHITSWAELTVTAQLPVSSLAAGRLPSLAPGEVHDLAPALFLSAYSPLDPQQREGDPVGDWWCDDAGAVHVRGALVPPTHPPGEQQVFLLEIAGRGFPLNWTNPEPFLSPTIEAFGGLYLDPRLDRGGLLGPTGDGCRASWRVEEVRRHVLVDGVAHEVDVLDRSPDPWDVADGSSYVVDLTIEGPGRSLSACGRP